ncbi:hypothetical protein NL676_033687 [Syzygium grande]|nr:hypothetical protein NL676_033687 [Syzygium grande]
MEAKPLKALASLQGSIIMSSTAKIGKSSYIAPLCRFIFKETEDSGHEKTARHPTERRKGKRRRERRKKAFQRTHGGQEEKELWLRRVDVGRIRICLGESQVVDS